MNQFKKYFSPKKEDYQATVTIAVTVKVAAERVVSAAVPPPWTRTLGRWVVDPGGRVIIELLALPPYPEDTTQSLTATPLSSSEPGVVPGDRCSCLILGELVIFRAGFERLAGTTLS